ncbi:MAG: LacI family transcriptional regulator [Sphingomonadales bacterium BRH_c42]|nr:MAG: LacI family transcriptional regulator [Sphingomonadales bacterium BRH_c42]
MAKPPATIRDVARHAGLSVASISRVLNGHNHVHPDTRKKVIEAMNALGYIPNAAARSLSTAKSHAIGVVLPDLHGEFFGEVVRGMDKAASERGYLLLLSTMHADSRLAHQAMGTMRGRVDGLIIMAPQLSAEDLAQAIPADLPAVLINSPADATHYNLRIDNRGGVMLMVRHLLAGGRKNIVHLAGYSGNLDAAERADAFREAMQMLAPDLPVRIVEGDFTDASGEQLVQQLLADGTQFDAIFAANDMMALGALQTLRTVGIEVPAKVAVAGFDDVPMARHLGLSTVRVDMAGIGERAVRRLIDQLEGSSEPPALARQSPTLVARASTGR